MAPQGARGHDKVANESDMNAFAHVTIGMMAEKSVTVTSEMAVSHFVANMPQVSATPK